MLCCRLPTLSLFHDCVGILLLDGARDMAVDIIARRRHRGMTVRDTRVDAHIILSA